MTKILAYLLVTIVLFGSPQLIFGAEADGQERTLISSGSKWQELAAYSRAVVDGDWIFLSGTVGFNPEDNMIPQDFDQQMDNIFSNISNALAKAAYRARTDRTVPVRLGLSHYN